MCELVKTRGWTLPAGIAVLFALCTATAAQAPKAFEAVSIRLENPGASTRPSSRLGEGRFEIVAVRPWELVARAYNVEQLLRIDIPDWAQRDRFSVRAITPPGTTEQDLPAMLRRMLEDRFQLKARVEQRPYPVYQLIVSPSGPKVREVPAADDLKKPFTSAAGPAIADVINGLPGDELRTISAPAGPNNPSALHYITSRTSYTLRTLRGGVRQIEAARITMSQFAGRLQPSVDRPVVDRTGLTGIYELKILLPPPARLSPSLQAILGDRRDTTPTGVSMSRALDELGLKLEPIESPVDFIIVDRIERPSTN